MLNQMKEEYKDSVYDVLINSDICVFLSEIMNLQDRTAMSLVNKIVCHLSESGNFFKNDFFRILKSYTRVINSLPQSTASEETEKFHEDIFMFVNILIKRARENSCDFSDARLSLNSLVTVINELNQTHFIRVPVLDFINLIIELMISVPAKDANDQKHRDEKLLEVIRKLKVTENLLNSLTFFLLTSKILNSAMNFSKKITTEQNLICQLVIDKFLALMDFAVTSNKKPNHHEVFCNSFFYFLTTEKLKINEKLQLVSRFFVLDGHELFLAMISEKTQAVQFKSIVVMAEVLNLFLKFLSKSSDKDATWKKKSYKIVSSVASTSSPEINSDKMLFYIFMKFVDLTCKKKSFDKDRVLSQSAMILATLTAQKISLEPPYFNMLTTLFTTTYVNVAINGNNLLQVSSDAILDSIENVKFIDLKFLTWWKSMGKPNSTEFNKIAMNFLLGVKFSS